MFLIRENYRQNPARYSAILHPNTASEHCVRTLRSNTARSLVDELKVQLNEDQQRKK